MMLVRKPKASIMRLKTPFVLLSGLFWLLASYGHAEQNQPLGQEILTEKIRVHSYYGSYDARLKQPGEPAPSLGDFVEEQWQAPLKANRSYNIAVLFPHLKDPFWVAVNYGVAMEAKKYGVGMRLWHAGGYRNLGKQVLQMQYILDHRDLYDGLIIGAVQFSKPKLEDMFEKFHQAGIPIVSVVNDSYTPSIKAKALVSWEKLGFQAGKYLTEHANGKKAKVLIMPGPKGTGWAPDSLQGINDALETFDTHGAITTLPPIWGDTGDKAQRHLLRFILKRHENIDYLVGNALAANAMISKGPNGEVAPIDEFKERHPNIQVISTYITQQVYDAISHGQILASATDQMKQQGMMSVDMMIKYLNGEAPGTRGDDFPFRSGPIVPIIHAGNIKTWSFLKLFGTRDFKPVFTLEPRI